MTDIRESIFSALRATGRPGVDALLDYLDKSSYFTRGCYGHHKEQGGLAAHCHEVYLFMLSHNVLLPKDSIAIAGLLHDLGKTNRNIGTGGHGHRSVAILDHLGFSLTDAERKAIGCHHDHNPHDYATCPLLCQLSAGDCDSTRRWKHAHPELCHYRRHSHASTSRK